VEEGCVTTVKRKPTNGPDGKPNGEVLPIWNCHEQPWRPDQVYVTTVYPGCSKGPHLHHKRHGRFFVLHGFLKIILRRECEDEYTVLYVGARDAKPRIVDVPPGTIAQLVNEGSEEAKLLNMPTPAWTPQEPDDIPVTDWDPPK
jgi:dTDP-4-dehydrorhamnose 3,5-epimerase-like enzyme